MGIFSGSWTDLSRKWKFGSRKDKKLSSVVMNIAPSIVFVWTFTGVPRKVDCSGLIIDWDDSNRTTTILTSAKVIWFPENSNRDNYYEINLLGRLAGLWLPKLVYKHWTLSVHKAKFMKSTQLRLKGGVDCER